MAYVRFDDHGYEYFDEGNYILFSEDNAHEYLFQYITQDLSHLPELFNQYISQRMDTSTFALLDRPDSDILIDQMKSTLVAVHPYYKHEIGEVLIRAIGNYFNNLLLYSCYHQHTLDPNFSEEWYMERLIALLAPLLESGDPHPNIIYNGYQEQTARNGYSTDSSNSETETFVLDVPREKPIGLSNEIRTQREVYNMLYFLLDISAQGLDELTTLQRMWLYSNIKMYSGMKMTVPKQISFMQPTLYRAGGDYDQEKERNREADDKFRPLQTLGNLNVGRDGIPADMEEDFRSAIDYTKKVTENPLYDTYKIENLYQLLYLEIWSMVRSKIKIRKCRHCGKYFVAATRRIVYCDRVDETGVRCSAVGYQEAFQKKMENDEPLQIYKRAYKTHHARLRKGTMGKDAFQLWCNMAKRKLEEVRAGNLDIVRFQEWLKK